MYIPQPSISKIIRYVQQLNVAKNETICLLFGEDTTIDYQELITQLTKHRVLGCILPWRYS